MNIKKIMHVENLTHFYGNQIGCKGINFDLYKGERKTAVVLSNFVDSKLSDLFYRVL